MGRREVRELVRELAAGGVTVFLNSHLLTEVEAVCDRVAIVTQGRVVASGPLDDLAGAVTQLRLLLDRADRELLALLGRHGQVAKVEGTAVTLAVETLDVAPDLARLLVERRLPAVRAGAGAAVPRGRLRRPGRGGAGGMNVLVVARWTVLEARRRRLLLAGVILSVAFVALFAVGFFLLYQDQQRALAEDPALGAGGLEAREELLAISTILVVLGLYGVQFLAALLGLFLGVASVSPEIDSGALHAVLARPLSRLEYLLGRFLALAGLLVTYVVVMSGSLLLIARIVAGYQPGDVTRVVGLMVLQVLILLAVSLLGSTVLPTLANGVVMLVLFGLAWLGGIIAFVGHDPARQRAHGQPGHGREPAPAGRRGLARRVLPRAAAQLPGRQLVRQRGERRAAVRLHPPAGPGHAGLGARLPGGLPHPGRGRLPPPRPLTAELSRSARAGPGGRRG